ncbi:hypothetical protein [Fuerstiella marisgermanici]|uniref:hypothetical protein n=1 Tax=Fuerstiella marisgermanici TaxID=1891926 RepID=UPI0011AB857D|nr:hypothetical protein [Fuerstiella marisgermanici]
MKRTKNRRQTASSSAGLAQLSLLEHSLCPLDTKTSLTEGLAHEACYRYTTAAGQRCTATAKLHLPLGLSPADEFTLWGLLALTLRQSQPDPHFAATPHYCLRQLGVIDARGRRGGKNYQLFRQTLRRLSSVSYENDAFYDPVRGEHASVSFGFLSYRLPHSTTSDRLWHFYWDPVFFEFCTAAKGSLLFDLETYRTLSPAARRLFLLLHKVFFRRRTSPEFAVRQLAVHTLGFSGGLTNGILNRKLRQTVEPLADTGVIANAVWPKDRGISMVRFDRGPYFENRRQGRRQLSVASSPLTEALISLGFESRDAGHITRRYRPSLLREWIDITIAAQERFGAKHFKRSPQAFLMHHLSKAASGEYAPPDWWREIQKQEQHQSTATSPLLRKLVRSSNGNRENEDRHQPPVRISELLNITE